MTKANEDDTSEEEYAHKKRKSIAGSESSFRKWLKLLFTWEFCLEFVLLAVHPLPYVEQ